MADWEKLTISPLTKGYNRMVPPGLLEPGYSHKIENMAFNQMRVETDYGISVYGSDVIGIARLLHRFRKKSGVTEAVLITDRTVYKWAGGEWQLVTGAQATTVNGQHTATDTTILVVDDTGFTDGKVVGIMMDNGKQHVTEVVGAPAANVITIAEGVPAGRTFENGAAFIEGVILTGEIASPVTAATFPAGDVMIFTNGEDNVKVYDGSSIVDVPNLVTAVGGGNCYADIVRIKDNKVILFNTNENGSNFPQRVRWSATGDYTDWTTADDSGYEDLYDSEDPIVGAERVGLDMAVYRSESVYLMSYVGSATLIYNFRRVLESDGACSATSIVERAGTNVFMGGQGFYAYAGGVEFTPFGEEVWELLFGVYKLFDSGQAYAVTAFYLESEKCYYFGIPVTGGGTNRTFFVYDTITRGWTTRIFFQQVLTLSEAETISGLAWNEAVGNWEDTAWVVVQWDDLSLQGGEKAMLFAGYGLTGTSKLPGGSTVYDYGATYQYIPDNTDDEGEDIIGEFRTHELFLPEDKIRVDRVVIKAKGSLITCEYSEDEGDSWTAYGTATPGSDYDEVSIWKQLIVDRVIFRFTGIQFGLERITVYWRPESRY